MPDYTKHDGRVYFQVREKQYNYLESFQYKDQKWTFYDYGAYNAAFRSEDGKQLLKVTHPNTGQSLTNLAERAAAVWNEINPGHPAAPCHIIHGYDAWVAPFIEGRPSTPYEVIGKLIDIFNSTRRVVIDAFGPGNFLTTADGQVICVDVGLALCLERRMERSVSDDSIATWEGSPRRSISSEKKNSLNYLASLTQVGGHNRDHVHYIFALLFLAEHMPEIEDASFLLGNTQLVNYIAVRYQMLECHSEHQMYDAHEALRQQVSEKINDARRGIQSNPDVLVNVSCFSTSVATAVSSVVNHALIASRDSDMQSQVVAIPASSASASAGGGSNQNTGAQRNLSF